MRHMDPKGLTNKNKIIWTLVYMQNYMGFCENFAHPKFINRRRMTIARGTHVILMENSPLSSLALIVTSVEEEILLSNNRVDISRGWTLKQFQELIQMIHISMKFVLYQTIVSFFLSALTFLIV